MADADIASARALDVELQAALASGQPLVVQVNLHHCPFCKVVRENFLAPLVRDEKLPVVLVDLLGAAELRDFGGRTATHRSIAARWRTKVAPTVLFFGSGGVEVAERLVGASIPDFYGSYLNDRLETARKVIRAR